MSDEATNNDIMRSLGRIEQKVDSHLLWMTAHVAEDKLMAVDIGILKIAQARQRGFIAALGVVAAFISGLIGYAVEYFASGRAHH